MKKKYLLLPHYNLERENVLFLGKIPVPMTKKEIDILQKINSGQLINCNVTINDLINRGLIIDQEGIKKGNLTEIIVAAHSDDTALSLGGYVLTSSSKIHIVNVFSNCPWSPTLNEHIQLPSEVTLFNNKEEEFYARIINAKLTFLNYPEALQREYKSPFSDRLSRNDKELIKTLTQEINHHINPAIQLYFPLSIGNHIDHVILNHLGQNLLTHGFKVTFYEDLPYAKEMKPSELEKQIKEKTGRLQIVKEVDISQFIQRKILLASLYKTQYDKSYLSTLMNYALEIGKDKPIERMWGKK